MSDDLLPQTGPIITVVGSLNWDTVVRVPRLPQPGETVLGSDHFSGPGGKGANQAVAAARLGQRVVMIGRVGNDEAGRELLAGLGEEGVDTERVLVDDKAPTGLAMIAIEDSGENSIVVSPGANSHVSVDDIDAAADVLQTSAATLLQLEIPPLATTYAAGLAGGLVILNPAPARPLDPELLNVVDVLVPNETELALLAAADPPEEIGEVAALAEAIEGPPILVVTLGAQGALLVEEGRHIHVPAPAVEPVDVTAAGDAFCGALADALVRGRPVEDAVRWAVRVGAVTVTKEGAQASLPTAAEVGGH